MKNKTIYIIIDALRYDLLENKNVRNILFPNISKLIKKGFIKKAVANAQSTQFVLPSLFSSTYPLDHGGYNYGIRNRRSYIQDIKKNKIKTYLMSTCNQMGVGNGYDKGFDHVLTTNDYRLVIEQKINRTLLYEVVLYKKKILKKNQLINKIQKEFGITLDRIISFKNVNKQLWPKKLRLINNKIIENSPKEKKILFENPEIILNKMLRVSGGVYWHTLGKEKYNNFGFQIQRISTAFNWRFKNFINEQNFWPFFKLGHYAVAINDIICKIIREIEKIKEDKWHIHMHFMDVHDHRSTNNFLILVKRFRFFFKWLRLRVQSKIEHRFLYVSSVMDVDQNLGKLFNSLKENKILDQTLILITADHASYYAESPRKKLNVKDRTHYEDLDIPFIMTNVGNKPNSNNLCGSIDITATFLSKLGIKLNSKYKGESIFDKKNTCVISESCGSGDSDIIRKNVYFTLTTNEFKMMSTLNNKELKIEKLFNIKKDPKELHNVMHKKIYEKNLKLFINLLYLKRKEIFKIKGINKPSLKNCI